MNRRFDEVDKQLADVRRMVDRSNFASTGGDEKLLQLSYGYSRQHDDERRD
jgi:hypothetical protein